MSVYPITTSLKVVKELQFVEEVVKGVTPSSSVFQAIPTLELVPTIETESVQYTKIGNVDVSQVIKDVTNYEFSIQYTPIDAILMRSMINKLEDGTPGNRLDSFTFLMSQMQNVAGTLTEQYQIARGARISSITISVESGGLVTLDTNWLCLSIGDWSTAHGLSGTPVFASPLSGTPWSSVTTGSNPLSFGGNTYDVRSFSTTINHNTERINALASTGAQTVRVEPGVRDITLEVDIVFKDSVISSDVKTLTPRAMTMRLNTAGGTADLLYTDVYLKAYDETVSAESTEVKVISYSGFAKRVLFIDTLPRNVTRTIEQSVLVSDSITHLAFPKHVTRTMATETVLISDSIVRAGPVHATATLNENVNVGDVINITVSGSGNFVSTNFDSANFSL